MHGRALLLAFALALPAAARAEPPIPPPPPERPASVPPASVTPVLAQAAAAMPAPIRTGSHPGFGRLVFDLPQGASWTLQRDGDRLTVRLSGAEPAGSAAPPRNVSAIAVAAGVVNLTVAPGAQVRPARLGTRLVLDVLDPATPPGATVAPAAPRTAAPVARSAAPRQAPSAVAPAPTPTAPPPPVAVHAPPLAPPPAVAATPELPAPLRPDQPAPSAAPAPAGPVTLAVAPPSPRHAVLLPFAAETGAAAFRRGDEAMLVFDERRPIDTAALRDDPVFATAEIRLLPAATLFRLQLPPGRALRLARTGPGWTVTAGDPPDLRPIQPELDTAAAARLRFAATAPGHSVAVPDPLTGATLLVGTQREPGQGIAEARRTPEFAVLPTWQGVAIEAVSDSLTLRESADGFALASAVPGTGLALAAPGPDIAALAEAAALTRRFDFPALPMPALIRRLRVAADAAAVPAGQRTAPRIAIAQAMLALGLGAEAHGLLSLIAVDDPRDADNPDVLGLSAIAALLAGRLDDTAALNDPRLSGTDEIALWRALRAATLHEGDAAAAAALVAAYPLLFAYPAPLQDRLLPLAGETMALGGEAAAAQELVDARPDDAGLDFTRALLAEQHDPPAALAILDRLAQSPDRLVRARAAPRAVELRLAAGALTPAGAADSLDKLLFAWRGDAREIALRLRAADLRASAGAPRAALASLREVLDVVPDQRAAVHARMESIFAKALAGDETTPLPPLELVALAEENPDLIAEGEPGLALAGRLADRLAALDLPRRAAPVLEKLVAAAAPGVVRAELGGRLASTRLLLGDTDGALAALAGTDADPLPPPVLEARVLTWARATAARGDTARAAAALDAIDSQPALDLRAHLLEQARDWKSATATLRRYADRTVPEDGMLTEPQGATLLRLAVAAAQAGDEAALQRLRSHDLARLPEGRTADMLRLLTATPVQMPQDLPRASREAVLAGTLLGPASR